VQTALANGFNVEVWSWRACLSKVYTNMQVQKKEGTYAVRHY
jgi:hypothetical protein